MPSLALQLSLPFSLRILTGDLGAGEGGRLHHPLTVGAHSQLVLPPMVGDSRLRWSLFRLSSMLVCVRTTMMGTRSSCGPRLGRASSQVAITSAITPAADGAVLCGHVVINNRDALLAG